MNIAQRNKRSLVTGDRRWVTAAAQRAASDNQTITLDLSTFVAEDHYPDGYISGGTFVGPITASPGVYGFYDNGASDGRETTEGCIWADVQVVQPDGSVPDFVGAALLWYSMIDTAFLPANSGLDANARTDLTGKFRFIDSQA